MKKWAIGLVVCSLLMLFVMRYGVMRSPAGESPPSNPITFDNTKPSTPLEWISDMAPISFQTLEASTNRVMATDEMFSTLFVERNFTNEVKGCLQTWKRMHHLLDSSQGLPYAVEAVKEARVAWDSLMSSIDVKENAGFNESSFLKAKEKQCPYFLDKMNATESGDTGLFKLQIPCGLIEGSSVTIIGMPNGLLGNFQIDLTGVPNPGEPEPPFILHYNVRLFGDKMTVDPVIVQNTWSAAHDWGEEERCPSPDPAKVKTVDELSQCNHMVGKSYSHNASSSSAMARDQSKARRYFPFKQGYLSAMTLRVSEQGIQMTVDGRHVTSFSFRDSLEPWLVSEVKISGDFKLTSILVSGLPTSEDVEHVVDLEALKSIPLTYQKPLDLFIGVISTANNFKRRMAVRRTWMQYPAVTSRVVAVRFFVGLHKNQMVNEELWNEAKTYKDIQLVPFVDYYSLITWKTVAICIFGTEVVSAKYVMKTDDDAFVRVDEVLATLSRSNVEHGLLYGLINSDARPDRNSGSKWYITPQEWAEEKYPPWAHGPGYVVSSDIAKEVSNRHKEGRLQMFKLEDVAMAMWIHDMKKKGLDVRYVKEERVYHLGCKNGYVVAHYLTPRDMLCLWEKLRKQNQPICCQTRLTLTLPLVDPFSGHWWYT